jgi:hypothetical protein
MDKAGTSMSDRQARTARGPWLGLGLLWAGNALALWERLVKPGGLSAYEASVIILQAAVCVGLLGLLVAMTWVRLAGRGTPSRAAAGAARPRPGDLGPAGGCRAGGRRRVGGRARAHEQPPGVSAGASQPPPTSFVE